MMRWRTMRALGAIALVFGMLLSSGCEKIHDGGPVTGSVHVVCNTFAGDDVPIASTKIFLPDLEVYLLNTATDVESAPVKTSLFGRYAFPTQEPGTYVLSWKAQNGWAAGSLAKKIVIGSNAKHPVSAEVRPDKEGDLLFGSVTMADGAEAYFGDEFFAKQNTPVVGYFGPDTNKAVLRNVRVNIFGQFAIAGVPEKRSSFLQVKSEASWRVNV